MNTSTLNTKIMKKVALISITKNGDEMINTILQDERYEYMAYNSALSKKEKLSNIVGDIFEDVDAIVFICSLGICVRVIAPFIKSKTTDPAVVCIPNGGLMAISVLSGHLGGANKLTAEFADILGAQPIITTATDLMGVKAPDIIAKENGLYIDSMTDCKKISSIIVDGGEVAILDEDEVIQEPSYKKYNQDKKYEGIIRITNKADRKYDNCLKLIRRNIVLGIGCRKNYDPEKMKTKVLGKLKDMNLHEKSIAAVCSIDIKAQETAISELSRYFDVPYKTFTVQQISEVEHMFKVSEFVKTAIGVGAVAEPCVYLTGAQIIMPKINMDAMTLAIGKMRSEK